MTFLQKHHGQMSDSMLTAFFIILSGGLQDAYTYCCRGKVFANAQTGNIVLLSTHLFEGDWGQALRYLVPVLAFLLGIYIAECVHRHFKRMEKVHWRQLIILAEIVLLQEKDEAASSKGGANISLLKSYVEAHLDCETLSLKWLAENYLFVSVGYLSKQFVKEEGIRFSDYLNKKRMEQAIRLMVYYHNDNIKTIARSVGFGNNPQYFSQVFKKYTGYTPTEYIEKVGASAPS